LREALGRFTGGQGDDVGGDAFGGQRLCQRAGIERADIGVGDDEGALALEIRRQ
jgi:hypothetical protein